MLLFCSICQGRQFAKSGVLRRPSSNHTSLFSGSLEDRTLRDQVMEDRRDLSVVSGSVFYTHAPTLSLPFPALWGKRHGRAFLAPKMIWGVETPALYSLVLYEFLWE